MIQRNLQKLRYAGRATLGSSCSQARAWFNVYYLYYDHYTYQREFQDPKMEVLYHFPEKRRSSTGISGSKNGATSVPYKTIFCGDIPLHIPIEIIVDILAHNGPHSPVFGQFTMFKFTIFHPSFAQKTPVMISKTPFWADISQYFPTSPPARLLKFNLIAMKSSSRCWFHVWNIYLHLGYFAF
jgi:hypothetical protein